MSAVGDEPLPQHGCFPPNSFPPLGIEQDEDEPPHQIIAALVPPLTPRVRLISRRGWGARQHDGIPAWVDSTAGVKIHYTGAFIDPRLATDHRRCASAVRQIQAVHMDGNGWMDIGYSAVVCPHRFVFAGRGPHRLPAANGPGLNARHYAVCALVGDSGLVTPTAGLLDGLRDAVEWLRREGAAGEQIRGHRDGYNTDCPGPALYAWVKKGAPRPTDDDDQQEDNVTPDQLHKAVWERDAVQAPAGDPEGPTWRASSYLRNTYQQTGLLVEQLEALQREADGVKDDLAQIKGGLAELKELVARRYQPPTLPPPS